MPLRKGKRLGVHDLVSRGYHEHVGHDLDLAWQPRAKSEGTAIILRVIDIGFDRIAVADRPRLDGREPIIVASVECVIDHGLGNVRGNPALQWTPELRRDRNAASEL